MHLRSFRNLVPKKLLRIQVETASLAWLDFSIRSAPALRKFRFGFASAIIQFEGRPDAIGAEGGAR